MDLAVVFQRPVLQLLEDMTQWELAMWIAVAKKRPLGLSLSDSAIGIQAATVANTVRGKNKTAAQPADFTPWRKEPEIQRSDKLSKADIQMLAFMKAHNARVARK